MLQRGREREERRREEKLTNEFLKDFSVCSLSLSLSLLTVK
jgi:hypothetical protein